MLRVGHKEGQEVISLESVSMADKDLQEEDLRKWIINNPEAILGEDFLLIGREVSVKNIRDAIDLLVIDRDGNVVVIELKRGTLKSDVDFQGLKYAAYTSHWTYPKLQDQFDKFKKTKWGSALYDKDTTLTQRLEDFCNEDYTPNQDQRIVFVGESVRERLDIVLRWLSDRDLDVKVIEFDLLEDDGRLYIDAEQTIPTPEYAITDVDPDTSEEPWKADGHSWHTKERCDGPTAELLEQLTSALEELEFLKGPQWGQKLYVSFVKGRKRRIAIRTKRTLFHVNMYDIATNTADANTISNATGIPTDSISVEESLRSSDRPGIRITCKPDYDIQIEAFVEQIREILTTDLA